MSAPRLTRAEAVAATLLTLLASPVIGAYLLDRAGLAFTPAPLALVTVVPAVLVAWWCRGRLERRTGELVTFALLVGGSWLALLWQATDGLPVGTGPDLTHHLLLIDYLERHWRLVHDPSVEQYLGEMVHYTPGVHVLSALSGAWLGLDGLHTVHGVVAAAVALKIGLVFLMARRLLRPGATRLPMALLAPGLLLLPVAYVFDSFMRDSFFAQAASELFAIGMFAAVLVWDDGPEETRAPAMVFFGLAGAAAFLTWPVWIGPPCVALGLTLLFTRRPSLVARMRHGAMALLPIALVAALHISRHAGGLQMAQASGYVLRPSVGRFTLGLLLPAAAGTALVFAGRFRTSARVVAFMLGGIAAQSAVLYLQAREAGNTSAYMAFKTFYLFPYPLALLAVVALDALVPHVTRIRGSIAIPAAAVAWTLVFGAVAAGTVRLASVERDPPTITRPLLDAGLWARAHLPGGCVEYLVADDESAYWLHLAILHNRRISDRTGDNDTYNLQQTLLRWLAPEGLPYGIADLTVLPRDVRTDLDILQQFDSAAVVRRRGRSVCTDGNTDAP